MKRRGGDGERTMVLDTKDTETMTGERSTEMEGLCSKLMSLVPQDYKLDNSQGSSDLPSQLKQATAYIQDLQGRVEKLKQRRDDCYAKILQVTAKCSHSDTASEVALDSTSASHFDVNLTMNSQKCIEFHKVICAVEQDRCIEIVKASSCMVEGGKIVYTIECRVYAIHLQRKCFHFGSVAGHDTISPLNNLQARSSEVGLDAPMVETRLRRLFIKSHTKPEGFGA